jgi:hypothetical protein
MPTNPFKKKPDKVDPQIDAVLARMSATTPGTDEYAWLCAQLIQLETAKTESSRRNISKDTLVIVGANFLSIAWMVGYEHGHALTTKAVNRLFNKTP